MTSMISLARKLGRLTGRDRRLIMEVVVLLPCIWIGLRIFRYSTLRRLLGRAANLRFTTQADTPSGKICIDRIAWAVTAVAARLRLTNCLVTALTGHVALWRHGFVSEVRFGVPERRTPGDPLIAHAWIECGGRVVIGDTNDLPAYAVLSSQSGWE